MPKKVKRKVRRPAPEAAKEQAPRKKRAASGSAPVKRRARKRGKYNLADHAGGGDSRPSDDKTIRPGVHVNLIRPVFNSRDSLVFRPLWCMDDEDVTKRLPYRFSMEPQDISDIIRAYPAAKYVGIGEERATVILYDPTDDKIDVKANPYKLIHRLVHQRVEYDKNAPSRTWDVLLKGTRGAGYKDKGIPAPTDLYFMQGLIFAKGRTAFVGGDKIPLGAASEDEIPVIQMSRSVGRQLLKEMDLPNEDYDGPENRWEFSMLHGDIVHPKFGRFIHLTGKDADSSVDDLDSGSGWGGGRRGRSKSVEDNDAFGGGYGVHIEKIFTFNGKEFPQYPVRILPDLAKQLDRKIKLWDEILHIPETQELCLILAKCLSGARDIIEMAWQDYPEYMTADIKAILANAKQFRIGAVPGSDDEHDVVGGRRPRRSAAVPEADDVDDSLDYGEDDYGEEPGGPEAATRAGYAEEESPDAADEYDDYDAEAEAEEEDGYDDGEEGYDEEVYDEEEPESDEEEEGSDDGEYDEYEEDDSEEEAEEDDADAGYDDDDDYDAEDEEEGDYDEEEPESDEEEEDSDDGYGDDGEDESDDADGYDEYEDEGLPEAAEEDDIEGAPTDEEREAMDEVLNAARQKAKARSSARQEPPAKPAPAKKPVQKKSAAKKAPAKKSAAKKSTAKKSSKKAGEKPAAAATKKTKKGTRRK